MAKIFPFGTAPEQKADGYSGIGEVTGKDDVVLRQFFGDVRLVRGAYSNNGDCAFYVMVRVNKHGVGTE